MSVNVPPMSAPRRISLLVPVMSSTFWVPWLEQRHLKRCKSPGAPRPSCVYIAARNDDLLAGHIRVLGSAGHQHPLRDLLGSGPSAERARLGKLVEKTESTGALRRHAGGGNGIHQDAVLGDLVGERTRQTDHRSLCRRVMCILRVSL